MSTTIVNAAPMSVMLGTEDLSTRTLPGIEEALPSHLAKIYGYAKKGPTTPQLLSGGDLLNMYSQDTFDLRKKWATHATVLANLINAQGNAIMFERVKPADAGPNASLTLYLDVVATTVPVYQRNSDGSYVLDSNSNPVPDVNGATVNGYKAMWVTDKVKTDAEGNSLFGQSAIRPGVQLDTTGDVQSQQFPIMDLEVSSFGSYGNNIGLRMWAPTAKSTSPINPALISSAQCYPFRMSCVSRTDEISTAKTVGTQFGEQYVNVVFKPNVIDVNTDSLVSINDVFVQAYQSLDVPGFAPTYGPFGQIHTYDANISVLLKQFYAAELPWVNGNSDIQGIANEEYVFNMISGMSSTGAPYMTFVLGENTGNGGVHLTENSTLYATGGSDGTMGEDTTLDITTIVGSITGNVLTVSSGDITLLRAGQFLSGAAVEAGTTILSGADDSWIVSVSQTAPQSSIQVTVPGFAGIVADLVAEYGNIDSVLQDSATYPESIIYDSGFPLKTKYALANFISIRKDTAVVLACHDVTKPVLSASEESSLAIALRTRLQMYPESEYFGTATMRAMVVGRSGTLLNSQYTKPLPLVLEIATKAAKYMGAANGVWKSGQSFDRYPNSQVSMFSNVNVKFTPVKVRNKDWSNGLCWVDAFDRRSLYFPALKTIFNDDTSVLNSFFTMMAIVELEKVGERARRTYSGASDLTENQLITKVNDFVNKNTLGRFDGRFVIKPNTYFTSADVDRGFSWTLAIAIYAPSMKTVMTLSIQSYRIGDLQSA